MNILTSIKNLANTTVEKGIKYAPELMLSGSLIALVGAIYTTAKASFEVKDILDDRDKRLSEVEEENKEKEEIKIKRETNFEIVKLYSVPAALTITSAGLSIGAFSKMKARYLGAVAAYNALNVSFKKYRENVIAKDGIEKDREYMYGSKSEVIDVNEEGEVKNIELGEVPGLSMYSYIFSQYRSDGKLNSNWDEQKKFNLTFMRAQQSIFNDILTARGHVFLNEVLDAIGLPHTKAGAVVGWVKGHGDGVIDFGLINNECESIMKNISIHESDLILDFNVDGVIYDLI